MIAAEAAAVAASCDPVSGAPAGAVSAEKRGSGAAAASSGLVRASSRKGQKDNSLASVPPAVSRMSFCVTAPVSPCGSWVAPAQCSATALVVAVHTAIANCGYSTSDFHVGVDVGAPACPVKEGQLWVGSVGPWGSDADVAAGVA